jgi:hypothetical protein
MTSGQEIGTMTQTVWTISEEAIRAAAERDETTETAQRDWLVELTTSAAWVAEGEALRARIAALEATYADDEF